MSTNERRLLPRTAFAVPVRYRVLGQAANTSQVFTGESLNWCERGIYLTTKNALTVGMPLEMYMKVPSRNVGEVQPEVRCSARVVHVKQNAGSDGRTGAGIFIDRFEPVGANVAAQGFQGST
jgi:hypothetical protein